MTHSSMSCRLFLEKGPEYGSTLTMSSATEYCIDVGCNVPLLKFATLEEAWRVWLRIEGLEHCDVPDWIFEKIRIFNLISQGEYADNCTLETIVHITRRKK